MTLFLGLDIGTFESKGVLVDAQGVIRAQARRPHKMLVPQPGWAEHRADDDWWGDFKAITRDLLAAPGIDADDVAAVACSAIGPCMLPVDAQGAPLMNGVLYGVDTRATAQIAAMNRDIGADTILATCGNSLTSQSIGPKILWLREERPGVFAETALIHTSTSYLLWKLTGKSVIDHYTAVNFAPLYDVTTQAWTEGLSDVFPIDRLPRLMWSTEIAGHVSALAAQATGLREGTPVTCGTIDAAAEAVSVGVAAPGEMMVMYGSTIFTIQVTDAPLRGGTLWYAPWLFPGQHASMAGLATSGTLTHWFRDTLARDADFGALAAEAAASPKGANGVLCLPHFSGERTPLNDPLAKGAFFGLNMTHGRGDLYRAVLEGIAAGTAQIIDTCRLAGASPSRVLAVGGGTQNAVWMQATSDMGGVVQDVCEKTIGASYGDAFLAALAMGAVGPGDIACWNPVDRQVQPQPVPAYDRQYPLWQRLYAQTCDISAAL